MQSYRITLLAMIFILVTTLSYAATPSSNVSYETKLYTETNNEKHYTIKVKYPLFKNGPNSEKLNGIVKKAVDHIVAEFKSDAKDNVETIPDLPKTSQNRSTLDSNFKVYNQDKNHISIRFDNYRYFYGSAHPNTDYISINYDLNRGRVLTLNDIFKPNTNYLQVLADYSRKDLTQKLAEAVPSDPVEPLENGIAPKAENYAIWNMTPKGLLITFPAYQVAAYAFGPQEVIISYGSIKNILRP